MDLRFDGVFPRHWRLQHRLCMRFLTDTRADLLEVLEQGSEEAEDVTKLLKVIHVYSPVGRYCNVAMTRHRTCTIMYVYVAR